MQETTEVMSEVETQVFNLTTPKTLISLSNSNTGLIPPSLTLKNILKVRQKRINRLESIISRPDSCAFTGCIFWGLSTIHGSAYWEAGPTWIAAISAYLKSSLVSVVLLLLWSHHSLLVYKLLALWQDLETSAVFTYPVFQWVLLGSGIRSHLSGLFPWNMVLLWTKKQNTRRKYSPE